MAWRMAKDEGVGKSDRKYLESILRCIRAMIKEADSLRQYARNKKAEDLKEFQAQRKLSWDVTVSLLQLNDEIAEKLDPGGKNLGK